MTRIAVLPKYGAPFVANNYEIPLRRTTLWVGHDSATELNQIYTHTDRVRCHNKAKDRSLIQLSLVKHISL